MKKYFPILICLQFGFLLISGQTSENSIISSVNLFNPTKSNARAVVEVPTGSLATPGLINWENVHLEHDGKIIPFSIGEGKAHWKAELRSPVRKPSAEDLLIFSPDVPAEKWIRVNIVKGPAKSGSVVKRDNGMISISYVDMKVMINEHTGMLTGLEVFGESLLAEPMQFRLYASDDGVVDIHGNMNPGNRKASLSMKTGQEINNYSVRLVSWSSNAALTELNFEIKHNGKFSVGLTYRIYPNNRLQIISDERKWEGRSPWLDYQLKYTLQLSGKKKELNGFQTHFPYYGFKDYAASVSSKGIVHETNTTSLFELGEESINGRFWKRKLAVFPLNIIEEEEDILNIIDEGLAIKPEPISYSLSNPTDVIIPAGASEIGKTLIDALTNSGIQAKAQSETIRTIKNQVSLNLSPDNSGLGIKGDGFRIMKSEKGVEIAAVTKFGLYKAVDACIQHLNVTAKKKSIPLISSNPVNDLRAGGFGGGTMEVDFPYEDEKGWKKALEGMMSSGMNAMTDLGMWSNWKMPVSFKYMPELSSDDPDAYDEVSGTKFSDFDSSRAFALKLIKYLHDRGAKVWLWIPVGTVPTTFEEKFPEATVERNTIQGIKKVPRFMHPTYRRYLESYFKELLETYPIDGFVMIRDDNGGIDDTPEFQEYLKKSKTKDRVWEQYIMLNRLIRGLQFKGEVAVYPYFDLYKPSIESAIPDDMLIVGHGSGIGVLTRNFETLGTMGDTWLDNLFAGFRIPSSPRMKRLLSDRGSYWIGGAYYGMELSWQAIGFFGWQPSATVNTFRYSFGARNFGKDCAEYFVAHADASDNLWEIMNVWLFPPKWFSLSDSMKKSINADGLRYLKDYRENLETLQKNYKGTGQERWFSQANLYATYFGYHLERAMLAAGMEDIALSHLNFCATDQPLPGKDRNKMIEMNDRIFSLANEFDKQLQETPGAMLQALHDQKLTVPFREFVYGYTGYNVSVDQMLKLKQFDGEMQITTGTLSPGKPFEIVVELKNTGFMPWIKDTANEIRLQGNTKQLGLNGVKDFINDHVVFGDKIKLVLKGVAPSGSGSEQIKIDFRYPYLNHNQTIGDKTIELKW